MHFIETDWDLLRVLPANMVPVVGVDHGPATASPGPPVSVSVPDQLGSASVPGLEAPPTVSDHTALMIIVANDWSISIFLRLGVVHYRPLHLIPLCKHPRN